MIYNNGAMKKGFVIPLFLVLVTALLAIIGSVTYLATSGIRNISGKLVDQRVYYIAEAGIYKAVWYLTAPGDEGGLSMAWRTTGVTEEFGGGSYEIIVENYPNPLFANSLKIISTGSYKDKERTIQVIAHEDFADVFTEYAIFSTEDIDMVNQNIITGNLYADGNVKVASGSKVQQGKVAVTEGNTITGEGEYETGGAADVPQVPTLDTTYYDNQLAVAAAGGPDVVQGDQSYNGLDLNGLTLYVNGNVWLTGIITGSGGEIIATGDITIKKYTSIDPGIKLISGNVLDVDYHKVDLYDNVILYASEKINLQANLSNNYAIFVICPKQIFFGNNNEIDGRVYGGQIDFGLSTIVEGVVIVGSYGAHTLRSNSQVIHKKFDQSIPPGFPTRLVLDKWT